jgi:hypothetical protein
VQKITVLLKRTRADRIATRPQCHLDERRTTPLTHLNLWIAHSFVSRLHVLIFGFRAPCLHVFPILFNIFAYNFPQLHTSSSAWGPQIRPGTC